MKIVYNCRTIAQRYTPTFGLLFVTHNNGSVLLQSAYFEALITFGPSFIMGLLMRPHKMVATRIHAASAREQVGFDFDCM